MPKLQKTTKVIFIVEHPEHLLIDLVILRLPTAKASASYAEHMSLAEDHNIEAKDMWFACSANLGVLRSLLGYQHHV